MPAVHCHYQVNEYTDTQLYSVVVEYVHRCCTESDMPYIYYVDNGMLFKMTVNQSMVQLVADVTAAAAAVTGHLLCVVPVVSSFIQVMQL